MQSALAFEESGDEQHSGPELVTTAAVALSGPEQLPLIRMLEVVKDKVDAIHAGQKTLVAEVREIRVNLPAQRRPLSKRTQGIHIRATWARRNGLCPCCQAEPVCTDSGRLEGSEFDHWLGNPGERERDSGMIPNAVPGRTRAGFRDEGEHRFRDEAEQFQADPGIAFGLKPDFH
jgi:hypothetical protein